MPRDASGQVIPGSYDQPPMQDEGGSDDAGIRQAIAERFPGVQPDKLDEIYQAWEEHSHWAQREGQEPDLDQFFQQYEADAQGFGGGGTNPDLPPEVLARIKEGQGQEQMQEMPSEAMQQQNHSGLPPHIKKMNEDYDRPVREVYEEMMQNPELDQNSFEYQQMKRRLQQQQNGLYR